MFTEIVDASGAEAILLADGVKSTVKRLRRLPLLEVNKQKLYKWDGTAFAKMSVHFSAESTGTGAIANGLFL